MHEHSIDDFLGIQNHPSLRLCKFHIMSCESTCFNPPCRSHDVLVTFPEMADDVVLHTSHCFTVLLIQFNQCSNLLVSILEYIPSCQIQHCKTISGPRSCWIKCIFHDIRIPMATEKFTHLGRQLLLSKQAWTCPTCKDEWSISNN